MKKIMIFINQPWFSVGTCVDVSGTYISSIVFL